MTCPRKKLEHVWVANWRLFRKIGKWNFVLENCFILLVL